MKRSPAVLEVHKQNTESSNPINIFHQNIRGLRCKSDELIHSFKIDNINLNILSLIHGFHININDDDGNEDNKDDD
jgi:hypothetical protein